MMTNNMDMLEKDKLLHRTTQQKPTMTLPLVSFFTIGGFLDEVASVKLNLHGEIFRKECHLGLFEAKHVCVSFVGLT